MTPDGLRATVARLAAGAGIMEVTSVRRLSGGRNNRVYHVTSAAGDFLLKAYYRSPADQRDRLGAEFAFSRFAWDRGIRCIPEPVICDADRRLGLYAFVDGSRLRPGEVDTTHVDQAWAFVGAVNRHRHAAEGLPPASEACFSLVEHVATVDTRVQRLEAISGQRRVDAAARAFVADELVPLWRRTAHRVLRAARDRHGLMARTLPAAERCLSPSDFGFHNVLSRRDGQLVFHDFEYAGWDDPAKLVADFFCQVQIPVSATYLEAVRTRVIEDLELPAWHRERTELLMPVLRLKWCCIALNDFVGEDSRRRRFATGAAATAVHKHAQLATARHVLSGVTELAG